MASKYGVAIVSPPTRPMQVARELIQDLYTTPAGLMLRDHRGGFYHYDGAAWPEIDRREVRAAAYTWLENKHYAKEKDGVVEGVEPWAPTRTKIDNVLDALRAVVIVSGEEPPMWTDGTTDPPANEIISMRNGLLHIPTRTLYDHTPAFFAHNSIPFDFDPAAPEPELWYRFLAQLWPDDSDSISALQEVFGYVLAGGTRQQKIFLLVGPMRSGKGTIARVLTGLLGAHNVAGPTLASLSTNFGLQPLIGKPLGLISDARMPKKDGSIVVERLLSVSGEDSLTIDRKYRETWTGRLPTRFLILTNELPKLTDSSGALASRFVLFVLEQSFLGREDPALTDKLLTEAPGIFNWALAGLDRLMERGYFVPPESGRDAVQQLADLSSPVSAFVRECCEVGADLRVEVDALWAAWKEWCQAGNLSIGSKAMFGRDLKAAAPRVRKARPEVDGERFHVYDGIALAGNTVARHGDVRDGGGFRHSRHRDGGVYSRSEHRPPDDLFDPEEAA